MTPTGKIFIGIFIGIVVWLLKAGITHFVRTQRIQKLLLSDISFHISNMKANKDYLDNSFHKHFEEGKKVIYGANYTASSFTLFKSIYPQLAYYLGGTELEKTLKFYNSAREFEVLLQGLFGGLNGWKQKNHIITKEDIEYLERKADRIKSIPKIVCENPIRKLSDLPNDYEGKKGADGIVRY